MYRRLLMPKIEKFKEIIRRQCRQAQQDEKLEFWLLEGKILRLLLLVTKFNLTRNRDRGRGRGRDRDRDRDWKFEKPGSR